MVVEAKLVLCHGETLSRQRGKSLALRITVRVTPPRGRFRNLYNVLFIVCFKIYRTETRTLKS